MEKNCDLMCIGCGFFMDNCGSHDATPNECVGVTSESGAFPI